MPGRVSEEYEYECNFLYKQIKEEMCFHFISYQSKQTFDKIQYSVLIKQSSGLGGQQTIYCKGSDHIILDFLSLWFLC